MESRVPRITIGKCASIIFSADYMEKERRMSNDKIAGIFVKEQDQYLGDLQ